MIYRPSLPADLVPSKDSFLQASLPSDYSLFVLLGAWHASAIPLTKEKNGNLEVSTYLKERKLVEAELCLLLGSLPGHHQCCTVMIMDFFSQSFTLKKPFLTQGFFFSPPPHPSEASKGKPCQARQVVVCVVRGCSGARPNWSAQLFIFISFHYTKPRAGERVEETQAQCLLHQL